MLPPACHKHTCINTLPVLMHLGLERGKKDKVWHHAKAEMMPYNIHSHEGLPLLQQPFPVPPQRSETYRDSSN